MNEIPRVQNTDAAAAADKARARQATDAASANAAGAGQPRDRSADSGHHPAQDAARPPAQSRADAVDSRSLFGAPPEKSDAWRALDPALRANLAPHGVTADQARAYAQLVNTGTAPGDQKLSLQSPDMQRIGHAVNLLPEKLRLDLFAQTAKPGDQPAKPDTARPGAAAAGTTGPDGNPYRVTIDTGKISAEQKHFGFDPPLITDLPKGQKAEGPPVPPTVPKPNLFGTNPGGRQSGFETDQNKNAAPGIPGHRVSDAPRAGDPAEEMRAGVGKFFEAFRGLSGPKALEAAATEVLKKDAGRAIGAVLHSPQALAAAITVLAPLMAGVLFTDNAAQRQPVAGAPEQTRNSPNDYAVNLLQQALAPIGGVGVLNLLADQIKVPLPHGVTVGLDSRYNPAPPKDAAGRSQRDDFFLGVKLNWNLP